MEASRCGGADTLRLLDVFCEKEGFDRPLGLYIVLCWVFEGSCCAPPLAIVAGRIRGWPRRVAASLKGVFISEHRASCEVRCRPSGPHGWLFGFLGPYGPSYPSVGPSGPTGRSARCGVVLWASIDESAVGAESWIIGRMPMPRADGGRAVQCVVCRSRDVASVVGGTVVVREWGGDALAPHRRRPPPEGGTPNAPCCDGRRSGCVGGCWCL